MKRLNALRLWLRALFRRHRVDAELTTELQFHLEREMDLNLRRGMTPDEARRAALVAFGGVDRTSEAVRDERGTAWIEQTMADARFGVRTLRRRPAFTLAAVAIIGLSIGTATAIYSLVDNVLFRGIVARAPGRLVAVWQTIPEWRAQPVLASAWDRIVVDYPDFRRWRAKQSAFAAIAVVGDDYVTLWSSGHAEQIPVNLASPSLLDVLGTRPVLGRFFLPGEDVLKGPRVVVISYDAWQSRFGGRGDIVGQRLMLDSLPYEIVGVLPQDFGLVRGQRPPALLLPAGQRTSDEKRGAHMYRAIGRLEPGVPIERAATEANQLLGGDTEQPPRGIRVVDYHLDQTRRVRSPLLLLLAAAGSLVLIATLNVAALLLGEAASREHEMSARAALGATRGRLVRQLLTESAVLAAAGAVCGVAVAWALIKGLVALAPAGVPGIQLAHVDGRVLTATIAIAAITGLGFGAAPALSLSAISPSTLLRSGLHATRGRRPLQGAIMTTQVALSVVLLLTAGLMSRSLRALGQVDRGFRADNLLIVRTSYPFSLLRTEENIRMHFDALVARARSMPGVVAAAGGSNVPFDGRYGTNTLTLPGDDALGSAAPKREAERRIVTTGYFETLGIPLLAGRTFTRDDRIGAPWVIVVSEALARREWPTESAIGKRVQAWDQWATVVGVVGDTRVNTLADDVQPTFYLPSAQVGADLELVLRTKNDASSLVPSIRSAIANAAPFTTVESITPMDDLVRASMAPERFRTTLIDLFGIIAAALAAVGLYGLTSRAVARRAREAGIRIALGATTASVARLILSRTMSVVAVGAVVGVVVSVATSRLISPYLFHVGPRDPATYTMIVILLGLVALIASWLPARRIGRVSPTAVLRSE